jgi:hypothetical protein
MNFGQLKNLSGALYYPTSEIEFIDAIKNHTDILSEPVEIQTDWYHFEATPTTPWLDVTEAENSKPKYEYFFRSGSHGRFLLVSQKKQLVDILFSKIGVQRLINNTPFVDIPGLVEDLMETPRIAPYSLGGIWARVEGQGQTFRTIVLYGNDLASSSLFRNDVKPMISPYRITLRKNNLVETLNIGSRGELSFPFTSTETLGEIDHVLRVISKQLNRLDWTFEDV